MEKKKEIVILIMGLIIFSIVLLIPNKKDYKVAEEVIKEEENTNTIAMYKNDNGTDIPITTMPSASEYEIDTDKSYCLRGQDRLTNVLTNIDSNFAFTTLQSSDKCYVWFNKRKTASETILDNSDYYPDTTPNFGQTACDIGCESTAKGLYKTQDDDGESYYFRGSVTDNWVKFAGYYWRIIRINGDNTIRLIYSGKTNEENLTFPSSNKTNPAYVTGTGTQVTISGSTAFNTNYNQNRYVGYMYGNSSSNYDTDHKNDTPSNIKSKLESWYSDNLASVSVGGKTAKDYIDTDAGFCGDRTPYNGGGSSSSIDYSFGGSTTTTYYGGYFRLIAKKTPDLHCKRKTGSGSTTLPESNDLYTISTSKKGNKALSSPVGLISADEVTFAGGRYGANNQGYYLYTNQYYWTMSPREFSSGHAQVFRVAASGTLNNDDVDNARGVRPVINLKADTKFTTNSEGNEGTFSNPYVVQ